MYKYLSVLGLMAALLLTAATVKDQARSHLMQVDTLSPTLPPTMFNYAQPDLPQHFAMGPVSAIDNVPDNNPITDAGATLGRVLFYDKKLSDNYSTSCSSCHQQEHGFSDSAQFSIGLHGGLTPRNSMGLANLRYYLTGRFFWDERAASLEEQVLMPIQDSIEMGMRLDSLVDRLQQVPYYPPLFQQAFGTTQIEDSLISKALAQFIRSMVSCSSRYDIGRQLAGSAALDFPNFTPEENLGKLLFIDSGKGNCEPCHNTDVQTGHMPRNNGLDSTTTDNGAGDVYNNAFFEATFKAPTLRNIELTGPYMHDGRFHNLQEVIKHYDSEVLAHPNLNSHLTDTLGNPRRLNLSIAEKDALLAFLLTLTDQAFITDEKWSDPFIPNTTAIENDWALDLKVFPIPLQSQLQIKGLPQGDRFQLRLFDMQGKLVAQQELRLASEEITVETLPKGVYLLEIRDQDRLLYSQKLIK